MSRPRPLLFIAALAVAAAACTSDADGAPTQTEDDPSAGAPQTGVTIFDSSVVHEIDVSFDEDAYDEMIATFADTGEKTWIEATVTIDGTAYERVGLRLKGNSSLAGLGGGFGGRRPEGAAQAGPGDGGGGFGSASADSPEDLPWLIRLDAFVEGQDHQGY